ncbi:MAG: peptidylprolyl isomerase [Oscillospiraceae bacterium]|nr:peptidylprolyl isomerase [Oscillospiraceae bacterium]
MSGCKGEPADSPFADQLTAQGQTESAQAVAVKNFETPENGEKIAVITVKDYGEIKIQLFPEVADKAVENFVGLAEMGYYDELIFHRIIPNFMNQGGDPRGNGTGGNSIWGESFDGGIPEGLYHFSGAIAYANSGSTATNGSQFYIVNTPDGYLQNTCEELMAYDPSQYSWSQEVIDLYTEKGGVPFLDGGYTVFGQVFEGMDVVRAMSQVETDSNDKPLTQVQIESIKIVEYQGQ